MSTASQARRSEEKLGLIVGQVASVRRRINSLAIQQGLFLTLALIVGAGAIVVFAAFTLSPFRFLAASSVIVAAGGAAIAASIRAAWRRHATLLRAAAFADERAGLKGRLATVTAATRRAAQSALWPYLLEDTFSKREDFAPSRIERRRMSRSAYGLVASALLAALITPWAVARRGRPQGSQSLPNDLEVDLDQLDVRPADPALGPGVEVTGDPATLRKLEERAAAADAAAGGSGSLANLMQKAGNLANSIQAKLTGHRSNPSPRRLRVNDNSDDGSRPDPSKANKAFAFKRKKTVNGGQFERDVPKGHEVHPEIDPRLPASQDSERDRLAGQDENAQGQNAATPHDSSQEASNQDDEGANGTGGSAMHGAGADPEHLFGAPDEPPLGAEGFEIMIDAKPVDHGSNGNHSYLPPKVRATLNPQQHADEPISKAVVPADDRVAIMRVFER